MSRTRKKPIPQVVVKFGKRIKKLRLERKLSQMDVGAALNIDRENIRKYEKGLQEPKLSTVVKFAKVFEVSFNELLGFNDKEVFEK
ncbi:helix-turn-helix domain-containing protein [Tenacibaculum maritimum]|uniref:helix-turn-helix domain-containing protein n=1 Tax=Tenacibaculum maritimum TaxID=107401 RepID=UPI0038762B99